MVKYPGRDGYIANPNYDNDLVQILFFEYKTFIDQVFKIKKQINGLEKTLEKPDFLIHLKVIILIEFQEV